MTRCVRARSPGQQKDCRAGSTERTSLLPQYYRAISVEQTHVAGSRERPENYAKGMIPFATMPSFGRLRPLRTEPAQFKKSSIMEP